MSEVASVDCNADGSATLRWKNAVINLDSNERLAFFDLVARADRQFQEMKDIERHGCPRQAWWCFWRTHQE